MSGLLKSRGRLCEVSMRQVLATGLLMLLIGGADAVEIQDDDPLVPAGLGPGDSFHYVFVALEDGNVSSSDDLSTVNTYVNEVANNQNGHTGSIVDGLNASWTVIGAGVFEQAAYDLDPGGVGLTDASVNAPASAAVYLVGSEELIATGFADMWDGSIATEIDLREDGVTAYTGVAHTGSNWDGSVNANRSFGDSGAGDDGRINRGLASETGTKWVAQGSETDRDSRAIYALSEKITIASTTPAAELSDNTVASNAPPGTLVGVLSDPLDSSDTFVLTNGVGNADNAKFQITDGTNLRTTVWMSQYSNSVSIAAISNGTALVTNSVSVFVDPATSVIFQVSASVASSPSDGDRVGLMQAANADATFSIVGGREDLFTQDGSDNLLVTNASDWVAGTTNYVTLRARMGSLTSDLVVSVTMGGGEASGTIFMFR